MNMQAEGLTFQGALAIGIAPLAVLPDAMHLQIANDSSELLLRTLLALDEKHDLDESEPLTHELRRQDIKLSLILDMMSTLLMQQNLIPRPVEVRFCSERICVRGDHQLAQGTPCQLSLYLDSRLPRPVQLHGIVAEPLEAGWTTFSLQGLSQCLVDNLDKFIFRHHRRQIALQRKA